MYRSLFLCRIKNIIKDLYAKIYLTLIENNIQKQTLVLIRGMVYNNIILKKGLSLLTDKLYLCIDLKSFYASVECVERGLNPLTTNLVVADASRTEKTICLAVSPGLKSYGIPGRPRLYQVMQGVKEINGKRRFALGSRGFSGDSYDINELKENPGLRLTYIVAPPRMACYMAYSTQIYNIYLKYVSSEDIHVYSIDEVFIDITPYLTMAGTTPRAFAKEIIREIYKSTGITATAGIGTNMYLAKIAMDIVAKHIDADENGVRIAELDEMSYRKMLWSHIPITDFWRIGKGYAKRLEEKGLYTMGDIARCSLGGATDFYNMELLYKMFGVNAELLIDHAWGYEPCTMADIKSYRPENSSMSSGQVLHCAYDYKKTKLVVKEMTDLLVLDLVDKGLVTDQLVLTLGYDISNLENTDYNGEITVDRYGRNVPKHSHGTVNTGKYTASAKIIIRAVMELYDRIVNERLLVKRINITANHIKGEWEVDNKNTVEQLNLFTDYKIVEKQRNLEEAELKREKQMQRAVIDIKKRYGKNAIVKGMNLQEGATAMDRNRQIGGHKA